MINQTTQGLLYVLGYLGLLLVPLSCLIGLIFMWVGATGVQRWKRCLCGYDLRGDDHEVPRCPECGRTGPFITVKFPRLLNVGLFLFISPIAVITAIFLYSILKLAAQ